MHFRKSIFALSLFGILFLASSASAAQWGDFTYEYLLGGTTIKITGYTGSGGAVQIPSTINGTPVVSIGDNAFSGSTGLTSATIPDSVTSIGEAVFNGCTGLTGVTIPISITSIGARAFNGCTGLISVTIPGSLTTIREAVFNGCTGLTGITIPVSVTSIEARAFNGCTGLISVTIPGSVMTIEESAFAYCTGLTSVQLMKGVTSIGASTFSGCDNLTTITIPSSVTSIGSYGFQNCAGLTSAYFCGNAPTLGGDVFGNCASGFTVYYSTGSTGFANPWYGYPTAVSSEPCTTTRVDNETTIGSGLSGTYWVGPIFSRGRVYGVPPDEMTRGSIGFYNGKGYLDCGEVGSFTFKYRERARKIDNAIVFRISSPGKFFDFSTPNGGIFIFGRGHKSLLSSELDTETGLSFRLFFFNFLLFNYFKMTSTNMILISKTWTPLGTDTATD